MTRMVAIVHADRSDSVLAEQVRSGDDGAARTAFDTLYLRYHDVLWRSAYRYVRSATAAEDVVQDVFYAIWARREMWVVREGVDRYLHSAVRHRAIRVLRRELQLYDSAPSGDVANRSVTVDSHNPEQDVDLGEIQSALASAIAALPQRRRQALVLRFGCGLSYAEIAEAMEISASAAMILVTRARNALEPIRARFWPKD